MSPEEELFMSIGNGIKDAGFGQLFGKPCFKINGKAFICFFNNEMVFKLGGDEHKRAILLANARLFDPSGKNRPMKEWIQLGAQHQSEWKTLASLAKTYCSETS